MDQRSSYSYSLQQSALRWKDNVLFCDHDICMVLNMAVCPLLLHKGDRMECHFYKELTNLAPSTQELPWLWQHCPCLPSVLRISPRKLPSC